MRSTLIQARQSSGRLRRFAAAALILGVSTLAAARLGAQQATGEPAALPPAGPLVESLPEVVARVNGHPITKRQLLQQADAMRRQAIHAGVRDPAYQGKDFLNLVADALIGEYLVYLDGQSRGITASEAEIDQEVAKMAALYTDAAAFDRALAAKGLDRAALRDEIRQQLSIDKLFRQEIETGVQVSEAELRAYYEENSSRLMQPPRVRARHILKLVPAGSTGEAQHDELAELRRQIVEDGAEFGQLAVSSSDDAKTRDLGGDIGWIRITGRKEEIGQLLAGLEVGEVSEVVRTQMGLHVFQVMERQPARPMTFEEARDDIAQSLAALHAREEVQRRVVELKAQANVELLM
jgi:parvulin-like peptidyl-prolyl isomerase